jgi:N-dimethylarginine dimethylaminohydrolase
MPKILLCKPDFFDIEYEINPWMHLANKVDKTKAAASHTELIKLYKKLGVETFEIEPAKGLPDMVYTANFGFVTDKIFIKANFKYEQRRREAELAAEYFRDIFNLKTVELPENIFYEGEGDHLLIGEQHFMGYGKRSDFEAKAELEKILDREVIALELVNPFFYHLDTALGPLSPECAIVNPVSFTPAGMKVLKEKFEDIILLNKADQQVMAANLMTIGKHVVIGKGISEALKSELNKRGFIPHEIDMREFLKGGGSIKCLSLVLHI